MFFLIVFAFCFAFGVPVAVFFLVVNYLFKRRKEQNDEFLKQLRQVLREECNMNKQSHND